MDSSFESKTSEYVRRFGLDPSCLDKEWKHLSGGESQRVHVAMAMASCPTILLLDESTSALDMVTKQQVEAAVVEKARQGTGILWVTHDSDQINRLRIMGRIV